ncbi:winged helix DNA-binding domain-containing protein, partial [Gymnopus androsaceus JB14]
PLSRLSFAVDPTVYYLLGQLEYYLSPQNMAQDFFLRQQMDSHGWIPIPLLASFNRIRQVTTDESFVRDVLNLSTVVEVKQAMVRMKDRGDWERFVLPGVQEQTQTQTMDGDGDGERDMDMEIDDDDEEGEEEEEEEEEEDVVFVMGQE